MGCVTSFAVPIDSNGEETASSTVSVPEVVQPASYAGSSAVESATASNGAVKTPADHSAEPAVTVGLLHGAPAAHAVNVQEQKALPLVTYNRQAGKYEIGEDAAAVLRSLKGSGSSSAQPIGVVSIAGDTRQGKSYILNRLTQVSGGFKVSPNIDPCTHGIWMWPQPVEVSGQSHKLVSLV